MSELTVRAIMTNDKRHRDDILKRTDDVLRSMENSHSKVLCVRGDVRFPQDYPHNGVSSDLSSCLKKVCEYYKRKGTDLRYVWAREKKDSEVPHYHLSFMADGNKVQNGMGILAKTEEVWKRTTAVGYDGLVDFCNRDRDGNPVSNQTMVRQPTKKATGEELAAQTATYDAARKEALERASYLAKTRTKGDAPKRTREFGSSRLPKD